MTYKTAGNRALGGGGMGREIFKCFAGVGGGEHLLKS